MTDITLSGYAGSLAPAGYDRAEASTRRSAVEAALRNSSLRVTSMFESGSWTHGTSIKARSDVDYMAVATGSRPFWPSSALATAKEAVKGCDWKISDVRVSSPIIAITYYSQPDLEIAPAWYKEQVIPEEGGPVKRVGVPFFWWFPAGLGHAGSRAGVKVERPAGRTTLRPVLLAADTCARREQVCGCGARPRCSLVGWQASGCGHPVGVPAVSGRGGMGHSASGSGINQRRGRAAWWRGPDLLAITRCPCPGLLTRRPWRRCAWPVTWPARHAWRRRRR